MAIDLSQRELTERDTENKTYKMLSVIVPVFNEVKTFRQIVQRIRDVNIPKEIIIVDDCSTDGTRELLKDLLKSNQIHQNNSIKIIFHEKNMGKGAAIRTAISHISGDIALIQDADYEYDPSEYPKLIAPIISGKADVVYGSRYLGEDGRVLRFWHTMMNKFLTTISNIFTDLNLSDMETCYKVFKIGIIKNLKLESARFGIEPEITAKISKLGCRIYEVPISYQARSFSEGKKIGWKDGVSAIYTIIRFGIKG